MSAKRNTNERKTNDTKAIHDRAMRFAICGRQTWSAVGSIALCVVPLMASEFMPVSLLTPMATDLDAAVGMAGQAI